MLSFAKNIEICEILPEIWNYMKFCQKYKNYVLVLPNLWSYAKFCQKYKVMF
jgi:hypothetical protein